MTIKRYIDDPMRFNFSATIVEAIYHDDDTSNIILDETYFYPAGGGQNHDRGQLGKQKILDIRKEGETVIHVIEGEPLTGTVQCEIDKDYRLRNMSAHTGQHILSAASLEELNAETLAVKMVAEGVSTVDVNRPELTENEIDRVEQLANRIIRENRPVKSYFLAPHAPGLNNLRRAVKFDKVSGDVRIVEIENFDMSACAGTHYPFTGMIGLLKILKVENYKGGSRLHFVAGVEALEQFQRYHRAVDSVAKLLSSGVDQIYERVDRIQSERSDLSKQLAIQTEKSLSCEAQTILADNPGNAVKLILENRENDDLRTLANLLIEGGKERVGIANQSEDSVTLIVACSTESGGHAGNILKAILAEFDGRGGGRDNYAQGVLKQFSNMTKLSTVMDTHLT